MSNQLQIIGFGVAGLGLALAADRNHGLDAWLARGVRFIDSANADAPWRSLHYAINANSDARDFLLAIRPDGAFGDLLEGAAGRALLMHDSTPVALRLVSAFFQQVAARLRERVTAHPRSAILHRSAVTRIVLGADGDVSSFGAGGELIAHSRHAVLAVGSEQPTARFARQFFSRPGYADVVPSDQVLRTEADEAIGRVLSSGLKVLIAGGSHSGFSCANYLLERFGAKIAAQQVIIASRHPVRQYYHSSGHALACGAPLAGAAIDPVSGQVNRLSGIRGDASALWEQIRDGHEQRVYFDLGGTILQQARSNPSIGLAIYAAGYEPRRIPVYDAGGHRIALAYARSNALTTACGNLTTETGRVLENLFGIGLGHALPGADGYQVGINYFHGEAAAHILQRTAPVDGTAPCPPSLFLPPKNVFKVF